MAGQPRFFDRSNLGMMAKAGNELSPDAVGDLQVGVHAGPTGEIFVEQTLSLALHVRVACRRRA
jgi:hypothetical protein